MQVATGNCSKTNKWITYFMSTETDGMILLDDFMQKNIMNIFREHKQIPHYQIPDLAQARAYQHDEPYPMNKAPFTSRTPSTPTCGQGYSTCK